MRKTVCILSLLLLNFSVQAQKKNKNANIAIQVNGVCGMCKKRIETAALKTKGVKFAFWNVKTHRLKMIIDQRKTDVKTIQKNIAKVGHDSKAVKATDEAYNSIHFCCKYREEEIVKNHKVELKKKPKK